MMMMMMMIIIIIIHWCHHASSILIGYKHAANSCLLSFSYVISTDIRFYICIIHVISTDNSIMHGKVRSPKTLSSRQEKRRLCQPQKHSLICRSSKEMDRSFFLSLQVQLRNMYNKTIIGFGFHIIAIIIKAQFVLSASAFGFGR